MTAPVQKGTALIVGIGGYTYTGHIVEDSSKKSTLDVERIAGEDNETTTEILSDPGIEVTFNVIAKSGSTVETLKKGDTVSVNSISMRCDDVETKRSRSALKATIKCVKKDSMTYT